MTDITTWENEMTVRPMGRSIMRTAAAGGLAALIAACASGAPTTASPGSVPSVAPTTASTTTPTPTPSKAAVASAVPSPGTTVGDGEEWIAYQQNASTGIYLIRLDGSGDHAAFPFVPGGEQLHPDWSPDGTRIAFSVDGDTRVIWAGDADGSHTAKLVDCVAPCMWVDEGAWSLDGRSYIYHRMVGKDGVGVSTLEILDLATNKTRVVLTAPKGRAFYQPRWSPDSTRVVTEFAKMSSAAVDSDVIGVALAIVDVTAAKPVAKEITQASELTNSPDWSAATDLIVFAQPSTSAGFDGPSDIVTIHPDGTGRTTVISVQPRGGQTPQPAWSPDGSWIIFVDPGSTMQTVKVDGSGLAPAVATGGGTGLHPRYRPLSKT